jgi:AraC-like DNA-binding protein
LIALLVIGIFQAVLLLVLLLVKKPKSTPDFILSSYLFISAITIFLAYLEIWNRSNDFPFPFLINLSTPLILLIGPNLWLYVKSLTDQRFRLKPIYSLLAIPFLLVLTLLIVKNYILPEEEKILAEQSESFREQFFFIFIMGLIALSNVAYTFWGLLLIGRYRKRIKTYFSKTDNIDLAWLRFLLVTALISYASISALYIIDSIVGLMSYHSLQLVGYSIAALFVLAIGFVGLKQGNIFTTVHVKFDTERALQNIDITIPLQKEEEDFVHSLLRHMKEKKPYLNPDLTLNKLSDELRCTPELLSGVINGRLNMNFFDFINHHRIEEFKALTSNPKNRNLTLISLAQDSGFNSKATFNRVFKKEVGCTPSEYLKKV